MKVAAAIIAHNSARHLGACLEACLRHGADLPAGILVIDNASVDHTREVARAFAGVELIANSDNLGFAAAVNQAFTVLEGAEAVLLLNPDAVLLSSPALLAAELRADWRLGATSGLLVGDDGAPQHGFSVRRYPTPPALVCETLGVNRFWPSNPANRRYRALDLDPTREADGLQPAGACVLIRRSAWLEVGGFDERFHPIWFEDVDFFERLASAGWQTRYLPQFRARHAGAHSIAGLAWARRQLYWYSSLLRYADLHYGTPGRAFVCGAVCMGMLPRMVTGMFQERSTQPVHLSGKVVRLALTYLVKVGHEAVWTGKVCQAAPEECEPARHAKMSGV